MAKGSLVVSMRTLNTRGPSASSTLTAVNPGLCCSGPLSPQVTFQFMADKIQNPYETVTSQSVSLEAVKLQAPPTEEELPNGSRLNMNCQPQGATRRKLKKKNKMSGAAKKRFRWLIQRGLPEEEAKEQARLPLAIAGRGLKRPISDESASINNKSKKTARGIKVGIMLSTYPEGNLTYEQMNLIHNCILELVTDKKRGPNPHFNSISNRPGWLRIDCADKETSGWLMSITKDLKPWQGAKLIAMEERDMTTSKILSVNLPHSSLDSTEKILMFMKRQNKCFEAAEWKLVERNNLGSSVHLLISVDLVSVQRLKNEDYRIFYKFDSVTMIEKPDQFFPVTKQEAMLYNRRRPHIEKQATSLQDTNWYHEGPMLYNRRRPHVEGEAASLQDTDWNHECPMQYNSRRPHVERDAASLQDTDWHRESPIQYNSRRFHAEGEDASLKDISINLESQMSYHSRRFLVEREDSSLEDTSLNLESPMQFSRRFLVEGEDASVEDTSLNLESQMQYNSRRFHAEGEDASLEDISLSLESQMQYNSRRFRVEREDASLEDTSLNLECPMQFNSRRFYVEREAASIQYTNRNHESPMQYNSRRFHVEGEDASLQDTNWNHESPKQYNSRRLYLELDDASLEDTSLNHVSQMQYNSRRPRVEREAASLQDINWNNESPMQYNSRRPNVEREAGSLQDTNWSHESLMQYNSRRFHVEGEDASVEDTSLNHECPMQYNSRRPHVEKGPASLQDTNRSHESPMQYNIRRPQSLHKYLSTLLHGKNSSLISRQTANKPDM